MERNLTIRCGSRRYFIAFATLILHVFIHFPCLAGEVLTIDSDKQYQFAETLFAGKAYARAIDEYKRFVYFFPDDDRTGSARYKIGMSYYYDKQFEDAIDAFNDLMSRLPHKNLSVRSYRMVSECYVKLRKFDPAITNLENLMIAVDDPDIQDEAFYRIGWIYIETASFEKARGYFDKISSKNRTKFNLDGLFAELDKEPSIEKKQPALAGTLSILPGAGYLYLERYRDALVAFIVNGAMIYATYAAFNNDNPALGGILAFVELGFYTANIYGATTSAHKYNKAQTRNFIEKLKQGTQIGLSADFANKGFLFSFRYDF